MLLFHFEYRLISFSARSSSRQCQYVQTTDRCFIRIPINVTTLFIVIKDILRFNNVRSIIIGMLPLNRAAGEIWLDVR